MTIASYAIVFVGKVLHNCNFTIKRTQKTPLNVSSSKAGAVSSHVSPTSLKLIGSSTPSTSLAASSWTRSLAIKCDLILAKIGKQSAR